MRFRTQKEKIQDWIDKKPEAHTWFAWFPVETWDGDIVWLERVRRERCISRVYTIWGYEYKRGYDFRRIKDEV